jgi:hypothetical protein
MKVLESTFTEGDNIEVDAKGGGITFSGDGRDACGRCHLRER